MKKLIMPLSIMAAIAFGVGCNGNGTATNNADSTTTTTTVDSSVGNTTDSATTKTTADTSMSDDKKFISEAASGGLMEVELGKYAASNGTSAKVKEFGAMMVTDHTKANTELKAIAATKGVTVPAAPMEKEQKHMDEIMSKKGADFDKAYVDMMVDDHKEDISKFEDESKDGKDPDVKAFATKTLPVLNKHLDHIKKIKDGMK